MTLRLIEEWDTLPSTQDRAIQLAKEGAPHGSYVIAKEQTAGYGRSGAWFSPPGGLYLSLILDGSFAYNELCSSVHLMACNVAGTLEDYRTGTPLHKTCPWPWLITVKKTALFEPESNDIMIDDQKVGGIIGTNIANRAIFGIGINKNQDSQWQVPGAIVLKHKFPDMQCGKRLNQFLIKRLLWAYRHYPGRSQD